MDSKKKHADGRDNAERVIDHTQVSQTLHGTASAHSLVEIHDTSNNWLGSTLTDASGQWAYTSDQPVNEHGQTFKVFIDGQATQDYLIDVVTSASDLTPFAIAAPDIMSDEVSPQLQVALNPPSAAESVSVHTDVTSLSITAAPTIESALDEAGLETGRVESGATIDDTRPTFSGKSEAIGTFVEIHHNGQYLTSARVLQSGQWFARIPADSALEPGEHTFVVIDSTGQPSEPFTLTISVPESSRPVIDSVFDNVGVVGDIANGATTDDASPTVHGRGEPGTQMFLYNGTVVIGSDIVRADGTYTIHADRPLTPGEHTLTVVANRIASQPFTLTVADTEPFTKPLIESAFDNFGQVGEIANGGVTDDATPTLSGKTAPFVQVAIYDGSTRVGYALSGPDGSWSFPVPTLSQGEHSFTAVIKTNIGTPLSSEPFTLIIGAPDLAKPLIELAYDNFGKESEVANGGVTDDATPTLKGKAEPYTNVAIYEGSTRVGYAFSGSDGSWSFQVPTLSQGEHVFTVVTAGVTSDPFTLTIGAPDAIKPEITSVVDNIGGVTELASNDTTDDTRPTFHGRGEPGTILTVHDYDKKVGQVLVDQDGNWTYTGEFNKLSQGLHSFTFVGDGVTSEPFVLNVEGAPDTRTPQIDSAFDKVGIETGPVASDSTIDDNRPVFSGQAEPDSVVFVYGPGGFMDTVPADTNGRWTFQPHDFQALEPGTHTFTVISDGLTSEPFVLHVEAAAHAAPLLANPAEPGLPALSDLLQITSELFTAEADLPVLSENVELSLVGFDGSLNDGLPVTDTAKGNLVLSPQFITQTWQQDTTYQVV
ncbi:Ig-like domain-containing protein [Pseudomonas lactucae]|uniref:Ig-like domain-containing protein n=1 Tax=Pseudomonas lactucae TaxID=2813360 RepID=UPI00112F4A57